MLESSLLHRRLLMMVAAALLPLALFSLAGLFMLARDQRAELQRSTIEVARAMANSVDDELNRSIAALETLATSGCLDAGDLACFFDQAERILAGRPLWGTIILSEPSGRQLVNVAQGRGAKRSAQPSESESFEAVRRRRTPAVGGVAPGPQGRLLFPVRVPVIRDDGALRYVLTAAVRPDAMLRVLERQKIPPRGSVSVLDGNGTHVARIPGREPFLGKPAPGGLQALMREGTEGWGATTSLEGDALYSAYSRSQLSGWTVALGVPREAIDGPLRESFLVLGAGIVLSLLLGAVAAIVAARSITDPMRQLRAAAQAVGAGEEPVMPETRLKEVREVAEALALAGEARRHAESVREQLFKLEREARANAEEASRMKDEFLAMLAHELRNPLAAIGNAAQLLQRENPKESRTHQASTVVRRQVGHLARLMDDLLEVGRVMSGKVILARSRFDLAAAARQSLADLRMGGRLQRHPLELDLAPAWIEADRMRIEQVISNLLGNAEKYTPEGRTIHLSIAREGERAVLKVRDEGMGLEANLLPHIFDPFVQGQRALARSEGGLGLGLTLVRQLVELHGGEVSAHSPGAGKGSTFTVRLPAVEAAVAAPATASDMDGLHPHRVLVVEDNEDARAMLLSLLALEGQVVYEAADGPAGVEVALREKPELALVDLGLPGFDGYEVARRIRATDFGRRMRLVAVTGYGQPEDKRRTAQAGFDLHLVKPVEVEALLAVIKELDESSA